MLEPRPRTDAGARADILLVDDDTATLEVVAHFLRSKGHLVRTADNAFAGVHEARRHQPRTIFLDVGLPGLDGIRASGLMARAVTDSRIVLISGNPDALIRAGQVSLEVFAVLEKPLPLTAIEDFVRRTARHAACPVA